ncbi:MAG: VanW family protein [Anaerolineae bacterium]
MSETTRAVRARPVGVPASWAGIMFVVFASSLLVALFLSLVLYQLIFINRVYIGVSTMGVDLGGATRAQAELAVSRRADDYLAFPVTLRYGDKLWTLTAREAGATLDVPATVEQALSVGRRSFLLDDLTEQWRALRRGVEIEPVIHYDTGPANMSLAQIAQVVNRPSRDAQLLIHADLSVEAIPAQVGLTLDVEATREAMHRQALARGEGPIALVVVETPPAVTQVEEARRLAEALLSGPITFTFSPERTDTGADHKIYEWSLHPPQLAEMVLITEEIRPDGTGRVWLAPDGGKWTAYFNQLAAEINRPARDARFEIDPATGQLTVLQPSQEGWTLDVPQALARVAALPTQPANHIELPVTITPPAVPMEEAHNLGFDSVVAEATTYFKGSSEARIRNIRVAAEKFHGVVVPPGQVFSFNAYLGPVTAEAGFEDSLIIWGDRTSVGIGGGVCQVSTTAFRAAFFGGFEIVERWAHGYRVTWYEIGSGPGLDATIYTPDVDFKFRNDTPYYLLIQTYTDEEAGTLTFRFYGTPLNRVVTMEGPFEENVVPHGADVYQEDPTLPEGTIKQVDWAKDGVDVTVRRTVKEGDVIIHQDTFFSRYKPWRAVFLVGTAADDN